MSQPATAKKPLKKRYSKSFAVRQLEDLATADARRKHPGNPYIVQRTFRDDTANGLTACIVEYIRLKGAFVSRLNNTGIYDTRLHRYRPGMNRKGLPDVVCTYQAKSIMIEVKAGRDRMSEHQARIRQEQELSGGLFYVAHNFSDFKSWFDTL